VVWPLPCAAEIPEPPDDPELDEEPELEEEPELDEEPEVPEELAEPDDVPPLEPEAAALPVLPLDVVPLLVLACEEPGSTKATAPATARPVAAIAAVTARSRVRPRYRAATAARGGHDCEVGAPRGASLSRSCPGAVGCAEFIGFPSSFSPQSAGQESGNPRSCL